jgi:signal transduction histidine kinase
MKGRRKATAFFIVLGVCLVVLAVALNVGWILLNVRQIVLLVLGVIFFVLLITGVVLNTTFLVREIRRNEQHDAFINAVTHELKTPIASIRLYLETLKTREVEGAKQREFYDVMLADSDRLLQTVEQVLHAGRMGDKKRKLNTRKIDMQQLVRDSLQLTQTRYKLEDDALQFIENTNGANRIRVRGDSEELRAAIMNLLDNAVKYSPTNMKITVELKTVDDKKVAISIKDNGIGIPHSDLKRIFRRFYRVQGRLISKVKGTGLGLFIVQSVIHKHGGKVFAESEGEGKGSTFTIQLPKA